MVYQSFKNSWLFSNFQIFFTQFWTYLFISHCQNNFQNCLLVTYLRNIKVRSPSVSWFSPRLYLIWREFHASSTFHIFRGNLEIKPWKSAVCAGTASLQDSFERRKLSFLLVYTFFSHDPLMKRQTRNGMFVPVAQYKAQEATKFLNISRAVDYLYNSVTHNSILTQKRTL